MARMPRLPMQFGRISAALWVVDRLDIVALMEERMLEPAAGVGRMLRLALAFDRDRLCVPGQWVLIRLDRRIGHQAEKGQT